MFKRKTRKLLGGIMLVVPLLILLAFFIYMIGIMGALTIVGLTCMLAMYIAIGINLFEEG